MRVAPSLETITRGSKWATTVGRLCEKFGGDVQTGPFGSQLHASDYSDDGTPVVMPQDMQGGTIVCDRIARVNAKHVKQLSRHMLRAGDVVFSRRGDVARFAVITAREEGWLCGTGSIRIRLNCPEVDVGYLRHYLQQDIVGDWLRHNAKGVTMPNLNTAIVSGLPFVYPPMPEQRRIAAILDKADALRAKRREALAKLDQLLQSVFLDMFGDPVTNSKGWPIGEICDLLESLKYGSAEKATMRGDVPILRMNNLTYSGEIDLTDLKYISADNAEEKYTVRPGDILFNRTNSKELVGKTAVYDGPTPMAYAGYLVRARTLPEHSPEYISAFMNSAYGKAKLRAMCKNIVGMANINAREFGAMAIPVPPRYLQSKFQRAVCVIKHRRQLLRRQMSVLDTLFSSLQQLAFLGAL